jgi:hypothetical protein
MYEKLTQPAVDKMPKKHALCAHEICEYVPVNLHAHQIRHAKASHWLEDETTQKVTPKWKNADGSLINLCKLS